ncbi:TetR/AcrR family transcriptional regulator [Companilactobacillus baiquanensis]|uniref:TetR/AcrR family transcriptional regulator n=1 Tax=Companilactobacillus baiquanensis TaxID=2486005 RepID=A0ABW1V012_9LACO|nr:TetR/AcrR family transcriptional regulator [Companilactobacillus baiquanensis]
MPNTKNSTRRRGKKLEDAVLSAAWNLVNEVGYKDFTMSEVAKRANAAKPVLYRRWSEKSELVASAIIKYGPKIDVSIPDTGSLREDLIKLFSQLLVIFDTFGTEKLHGLLSDRLKSIPVDKILNATSSENKLTEMIMAVLKHSDDRGELDIKNITSRIINLPGILLINEVVEHEAMDKKTIEDIVDRILLPVFLGQKKAADNN